LPPEASRFSMLEANAWATQSKSVISSNHNVAGASLGNILEGTTANYR
jgi:hypothetical protein